VCAAPVVVLFEI